MTNKRRPQDEIDRYLATGESDMLFQNWPGQHSLDRIQRGEDALRDALLAQIRRREKGITFHLPDALRGMDIVAFTRDKVQPMVRGLFPAKERDIVLGLLERSVIFLTPESIEPIVRNATWLSTAWKIANIYLDSIGATPLGDEPAPVGLSEESCCYVSLVYFDKKRPFTDYVVHEAAHVFHNNKRRTVGLPATKRKEFILPIYMGHYETFAYGCEIYDCIRREAKRPREREKLFAEFKANPSVPDERVDVDELIDILGDAVSRRNGWKTILERCSKYRKV